MKKDATAVAKDIGNDAVVLAKMGARYVKSKTFGKAVSVARTLIYAGADIAKAVKELHDNDMTQQREAMVRYLTGKLAEVRSSIAALQRVILAWEEEQAQIAFDNRAQASMPRTGFGQ